MTAGPGDATRATEGRAMRFVDTNVVLYAISRAPDERQKRERALSLLKSSDLALSTQVIQEFYVQATRPTRPGGALSHDEAATVIRDLERFPVQPVTLRVIRDALVIRVRFRVSYWDAAILAAARLAGCRTVLSEDLSSGQDYGGVRVANPFAT